MRLSNLLNKSIPPRYKLDEVKAKLLPQQEIKSESNMTSIDIEFLIKETVEGILENKMPSNGQVKVIGKFGLDGTGDQSISHRRIDFNSDNSQGNSFISSFLTILEIRLFS